MKPNDFKKAIQSKTNEFEVAMELGRPHEELIELYKEIKELKYKLVMLEAEETIF